MRLISILVVGLTAVAAAPHALNSPERVIGGVPAVISQWPSMANVMFTFTWSTFHQYCGGAIINNRSILTAAHCLAAHPPNRYRVRVGSSRASFGGVVHHIILNIIHPDYDYRTVNNDFAIMRTVAIIGYSPQVERANIAGPNYVLNELSLVWITGWGAITPNGERSDELHQAQIWPIDQNDCAQRYAHIGINISPSMLCAGWMDLGRGSCIGDAGGPLYHNGIVVGITSFGETCADSYFPGIYARVSFASNWIQANAI